MSLTFFTDRNLGKAFPAALRAAGILVELHDDHFRQDTPDEVWLTKVSGQRWVMITKDRRIRYQPNELAAVVASRARMLVLVGNAPLLEYAANFVRTLPRIEAFLEGRPGPIIAKVYRPSAAELLARPGQAGRVEQWFPVT